MLLHACYLRGMQRCLTTCRDTRSLHKSHFLLGQHESVGWQASPWCAGVFLGHGPRLELLFPSVTSKFCPMHTFYPTAAHFLLGSA